TSASVVSRSGRRLKPLVSRNRNLSSPTLLKSSTEIGECPMSSSPVESRYSAFVLRGAQVDLLVFIIVLQCLALAAIDRARWLARCIGRVDLVQQSTLKVGTDVVDLPSFGLHRCNELVVQFQAPRTTGKPVSNRFAADLAGEGVHPRHV